MFDRFVRLTQARRALHKGLYEQALSLLEDPLVRAHRRADSLRDQALRGLLQRAERRSQAGQDQAALADVHAVLERAPEFDGARTLRESLAARAEQHEGEREADRDLVAAARARAEAGELGAAEAALDTCKAAPRDVERVRALIRAQREAARRGAEDARAALRANDPDAARTALLTARARDRALADAPRLAAQVARALGADLARRIEAMCERGDVSEALRVAHERRSGLPELDEVPALREASRRAARAMRRGLVEALEAGDLEALEGALADTASKDRDAVLAALGTSAAEIGAVLEQRRRGEPASVDGLRKLARTTGFAALARAADDLAATADAAGRVLERARGLAAGGDFVAAREALLELLEEAPMHDGARREMGLLDRTEKEWQQRLETAREHAAAGRLHEAAALALAFGGNGPLARDAGLLLRDVQARIDVVRRGLEQVQRDVHGLRSGARQGLEHCIAKLDELARVQSDEPELARMREALEAEIEGMRAIDALLEALRRGDLAAVRADLVAFDAASPRLLGPDRLEARFLEVVDAVIQTIEQHVAAGRLTVAGDLAAMIAGSASATKAAARLDDLTGRIESARAEAETRVREGFDALSARDPDAASECLDRARQAWVDGAEVKRLETALASIDECRARLADVESLAEQRDHGAARATLDGLGPTPELFRTRIFDLKKDLARAQGLDHGFVLRVDEGGEFLVLREETLSIGNVRDGSADIPVLANLAGRHARIRRSLSFHGGMQDRIEADQGEVFVDGQKTPSARLRDGGEVRLGTALRFEYRTPCRRSLTTQITLRGFDVGGTDKILLMKDRGRDGRIVIGPGRDTHVHVPGARGEVELYAGKDGRIRVRFDGAGSIDGRPFTGEEPITAGALVTCGGVSFVLQPWSKRA